MDHNKGKRMRRLCLALSVLICILLLSGCSKQTPSEAPDLSGYMQDKAGRYLEYYKRSELLPQLSAGEKVFLSQQRTEWNMDVPGALLNVTVEQPGFYRLGACIEGGGERLDAYRFAMTVDGVYPFEECAQMYFEKQWENLGEPATVSLPDLTERQDYSSYARSDDGYTAEYLFLYLEQGTYEICITVRDQTLVTQSVWLEGKSQPIQFEAAEENPQARSVVLPGENPAWRNDPAILELIDRVSAATEPTSVDANIYNTIGGNSWAKLGTSITWKFTLEEAGWYQLNMRCRQDYTTGESVNRRLYLDGSDASVLLSVPYATDWQKVTVKQADGEAAWFYLDEGEHTMTLVSDLGDLVEVAEIVETSLLELNDLYRKVLVVISGDPDPYRDYHLDEKLPAVFEAMQEQAKLLTDVSAYLAVQDQGKSGDTAVFDKLIMQLEDFVDTPSQIIEEFNTFRTNISALGTWLQGCTAQPLEIDWIEWLPVGAEGKAVSGSWLDDAMHSLARVANSFTKDYNVYAYEGETTETIQVWMSGSRDHFQIIQGLLGDFIAETGIGVELKLVDGGATMNATIAGIGPDVSLFNGSGAAVLYAMRHAVLDLTQFEGYDEVVTDFYESTMVPFQFDGGVYALPESQTFPVMFYRKDIFEELELEVPQTWDDVRNCLAELQKNNMSIGVADYATFLYQYGGEYYSEGGAKSLLNSNESVQAYKLWTEFYSDYSLPLSFDFLNRFRSGEVPLAIADYGVYNSLIVFAPEILGDWEMTLVPGVQQEDGSINRAVRGGGSCAFIFAGTEHPEASWEFLKWWVSGETQSAYARQVEIKLGTSARVNVASKSAFEKQMWTPSESALLKQQWEYVVGTPEVPGSYMVGRHITNAFRKIVYKNADIRETLNEYTAVIDSELHAKRVEYGLEE